jgi:non-ribosomal peptide synthetase component E (peptide arylation enzyme)
VLIEQLPMLPIGKVDKQQLRALAAKAAASSE